MKNIIPRLQETLASIIIYKPLKNTVMKTMSIIGIILFTIAVLWSIAIIYSAISYGFGIRLDKFFIFLVMLYAIPFSILVLVKSTKKRYHSTSDSIADELTKLSELKDKGVLTEEEFNTKKEQLLKL